MLQACVVIPVYRAALTPHERIAIQQCDRVLAAYPRVFIKPSSVSIDELLAEFPAFGAVAFDDAYFSGVSGYNRLMLSPGFYRAFADYQYILIHQLDALVFRDALGEWCARGYDYVGAPWIKPRALGSKLTEWRLRTKKWLYDGLDRTKHGGIVPHSGRVSFCVGNGGFSLRRVAAFIDVVERFADEVESFLQAEPRLNEDLFFSLCVNRRGAHLRIPDYRTAVSFAVEAAPREVIERLNGGQLPFGCHAWEKMDPQFWLPLLRRYGYTV
ncbi:MAG: DUF5672 family protein [Gammaproteobacteria bacterium]